MNPTYAFLAILGLTTVNANVSAQRPDFLTLSYKMFANKKSLALNIKKEMN